MTKSLLKSFAILLSFVPALGQSTGPSLRSELLTQGFSGVLADTEKVHLTSLGSMKCQSKTLRVVYYEWEESNPPGIAVHASYRLIFMSASSYKGSYVVADRPIKVGIRGISFAYPAHLGNRIACGTNGLPKDVLLDGEFHSLMK